MKALTFVRTVTAVHGFEPLFVESRIRLLARLASTLLPSRQDLENCLTLSTAMPAESLSKTVAADTCLQLFNHILHAAPHLRPTLVSVGVLQSLIQYMQTTPRTVEWFPVLLRVCDILQALAVDPTMTEHVRRVSQEYSAGGVRPPGSLNSQVCSWCNGQVCGCGVLHVLTTVTDLFHSTEFGASSHQCKYGASTRNATRNNTPG